MMRLECRRKPVPVDFRFNGGFFSAHRNGERLAGEGAEETI
jgi:hypothetical protein